MRRLIPIALWPAIFLIILWCVALLGNLFGGAIDSFAAQCANLALSLTWIIAPFTIIASIVYFCTSLKSENRASGITLKSFVLRIIIAVALTFITLVLWPRPRVNYIFVNVANDVRMAIPDEALEFLTPDLEAKIPLGENELGLISEDLRRELFIMMTPDLAMDGWGNPFMFTAEYRDDELWMGIYSNGQDGVSASRGNDPDDQNSWGQDGFDYYLPKIRRQNLIELAISGGVTFLFFALVSLVVFRAEQTAKNNQRSPNP